MAQEALLKAMPHSCANMGSLFCKEKIIQNTIMNIFEELKVTELLKNLITLLLIYSYFKLLKYILISSLGHFENSYFAKFKSKYVLFVLSSIYTLISCLVTFYLILLVVGLTDIGIIISTINWIIILHICTLFYCFWKCYLYFIIGKLSTFNSFDSLILNQLKKLKFLKKDE